MHLHFLGTSSGSPAIERNVSCTALNLLPENGEIWLFDCGEATQHQILRTSIRPGKIRRIFITHLHGDHIFGLLGLLCSRSFLSGEQPGPLTLYGGAGLREFVETGLRLSRSYLSYPIEFVELSETGGEIACDAAFRVKYRLLDHAVPSFGFRVIEADRQGSLKTNELEALGVPKGALYGALKRGETITLPNGSTLNGKDFIHPPRKGREVVLFGDTRFQAAFADFCADADVLVHEATFAADEATNADRFGHSTCAQAAELAQLARVKTLYLSHISAKFSGGRAQELLAAAQAVFPRTELAHDFMEAPIPLPEAA